MRKFLVSLGRCTLNQVAPSKWRLILMLSQISISSVILFLKVTGVVLGIVISDVVLIPCVNLSKCDGIRTQPCVRLRRLLSLQTFRRVLPSAVLPAHHATCLCSLQCPQSSLKTFTSSRDVACVLHLALQHPQDLLLHILQFVAPTPCRECVAADS